ncbi:MAG: Zn-ribbon domain-containing OB-fold protein [Candidatus Thorarchaeota archaeon]
MSKRTLRKSLDYIKKEYKETRTMPGSWYLSNYRYKFNITHHQPFLKKLQDKKLVGNKCSACNRVFFPPRFVCGKCLVKPDQWVDLRDTGQVSTYTIVYLKDPETGDVLEKPVVMVRQDSSDTNYLAELQPDIDFKDTYIGMPIKVHWAEYTNGNLKDIVYYDLIEDDSKDLEGSKDR